MNMLSKVLLVLVVLMLILNAIAGYSLNKKDKNIKALYDTLEAIPDWYYDAYIKCSNEPASDSMLRYCIAFEIKDLGSDE